MRVSGRYLVGKSLYKRNDAAEQIMKRKRNVLFGFINGQATRARAVALVLTPFAHYDYANGVSGVKIDT